MPADSSATREGSGKARPPLSCATKGKRQMLPSPTAEPIAANTKTERPENLPRILVSLVGGGVMGCSLSDWCSCRHRIFSDDSRANSKCPADEPLLLVGELPFG